MPRSRKQASSGGGRLQTVGIFLTLLVVAVLVGSAAGSLAPRLFTGAGAEGGEGEAAPAFHSDVPVRVEVLNAAGRRGLAAEGRRHLRDLGFDVVYIGNASGFAPDSSIVLDRVGRMDAARAVADAMGIRRVVARPDSNLYVDATVILGQDWGLAGVVGEDEER